jgi:hypothetical protein
MAANKVRILFRILAISMAGLHTWAAITSQSMNADGINYLDIGDAYFRGDWANAINPVWPPLYSWILGLVNFIVKPSMAWEFPTVHILNFVIFIATLLCFEFMWGNLREFSLTLQSGEFVTLPSWAWWSLGYSLFIWTSLSLIQIWAVTPDMIMAAIVYLAAGLIVKIRIDPHRWSPFVYLGLALGLGYLTKTFMFSMAAVFLGISMFLGERTWRSISKSFLAAGIFLLISLPFIFLISEKEGKFTIGDAGTVTYLRHVQGLPYPHWQGDPEKGIELDHPSRLIHQSPQVYEFGEPIGGTYPISTDPSYWYDGIEMSFNLGNQLARIFISAIFYLDLFFQKQGILVACVIALYLMRPRQKLPFVKLFQRWALVIPAVIAFGLYGLVLVSGRYLGVFVLLFWADILANIRLVDKSNNRSWIKRLSTIATLGLWISIVLFNLEGVNRLNPSIQSNIGDPIALAPARPLEVAQALQQYGVNEGDKVAIIGYGFDSFWARLARVKIVAEMLDRQATDFWLGTEVLQQEVLRAFASTEAKVIVAENVPVYAKMDGWTRIENSNFYIYQLEQ